MLSLEISLRFTASWECEMEEEEVLKRLIEENEARFIRIKNRISRIPALPEFEDLIDLRRKEVVVRISEDGKIIWINTERGCVLRVCNIEKLHLDDMRRENEKSICE